MEPRRRALPPSFSATLIHPYCPQLRSEQSRLGAILRLDYDAQNRFATPPFARTRATAVLDVARELRGRAPNDWEYARSIYDFVCQEIAYAIVPPPGGGADETLERGCGICFDKLELLAALARAGEMPVRFCFVDARAAAGGAPVRALDWMVQALGGFRRGVARALGDTRRRIGAALFCGEPPDLFGWRTHAHLEMKIGKHWIPADPTWSDEEAATLGLALPRFGYDPLILWGQEGRVARRSESLVPAWNQRLARPLFCARVCAASGCANKILVEARARWREKFAQEGKQNYVASMRRFYVPVPGAAGPRDADEADSARRSPCAISGAARSSSQCKTPSAS